MKSVMIDRERRKSIKNNEDLGMTQMPMEFRETFITSIKCDSRNIRNLLHCNRFGSVCIIDYDPL